MPGRSRFLQSFSTPYHLHRIINRACQAPCSDDDPAGSLWHESFAVSGQPLIETRRFCKTLTANFGSLRYDQVADAAAL